MTDISKSFVPQADSVFKSFSTLHVWSQDLDSSGLFYLFFIFYYSLKEYRNVYLSYGLQGLVTE